MTTEVVEQPVGPSLPHPLLDAALAAVSAVVGFGLLQPDWFHIQNGLDPFFYTGLSTNFTRFLDLGADKHYFVTRWSLYLPELLTERALGPIGGFVVWRLVLLAGCGYAVLRLRPPDSRFVDGLVVATFTMFSPLLIRAVFVDYSDAITVPCGLGVIVLCTRPRLPLVGAAAVGVLAALAVVANAFAVFMLAAPLAVFGLRALLRRRLVRDIVPMVASVVAVLAFGWILFAVFFDIQNVYAPTLDYLRENGASYSDPLKSPRLLWLRYRLWIYLPPLVVLTGLAVDRLLGRLSRSERRVIAICAAQYVFSVLYQFVRDGSTLEIHYYFSYTVPSTLAAGAVVLYRLLAPCSTEAIVGLATATTAALVAVSRWGAPALPSWGFAAASSGVLIVAAIAARRRLPAGRAAVALAVAFALPLASPRPEPILPGELRVFADYDRVFGGGTTEGERSFRAVARFVAAMKQLDRQTARTAGYAMSGGGGADLGASYNVFRSSPERWINPVPLDEPGSSLGVSDFSRRRALDIRYTSLVVLADDADIDALFLALDTVGVHVGQRRLLFAGTVRNDRLTRVEVAPIVSIDPEPRSIAAKPRP